MTYQDHLRTCSYRNGTHNPQKPTVRIKAASSYKRERKLSELAALITGTSYPAVSFVGEKETNKTKGASTPTEKAAKLKDLASLSSGLLLV